MGSAPSVLQNSPGKVDSYDVVVRVNNYKIGLAAGYRADAHYSFYGNSIRKTAESLKLDGVRLCLCKCPNSKPLSSAWHEQTGRQAGVDFRYIYQLRRDWWFCDTYVPSDEEFLVKFKLLGAHIPSTGFAAILDVLACKPARLFLTGFDFFASKLHNVDEAWRPGLPEDPIGHRSEFELEWLRKNRDVFSALRFDTTLEHLVSQRELG